MLRAIIAHPPREQELVETVNTTIRAYNKITRRQFCGDWCLLFVAPLWLCLFIFIGWGMGVPLFLAHVMYFFVTRAPIYHLLTHRKSGWDAQLNYLFDNADVVTGKTEYRYDRDGVADGFFGTKNVRKGQLHSTTTHRVGDAIPFMPFFIIVASMFMIPLIMVNLIRNYIIHWYGG